MRVFAIHFGSHEWWVPIGCKSFQFPSFDYWDTPGCGDDKIALCVGGPGFGHDWSDCVMVPSNVCGSQVGVSSIFSLSIGADKSNPGVGVSPSLVRGELGVPVLGVKKIVSLMPSPKSSAGSVDVA